MSLRDEFRNLERLTKDLISLLEEDQDSFWPLYLKRALPKLEQRQLAGATYLLGCFTGEGSMSDLVLASQYEQSDALRYRTANARLTRLRNDLFASAQKIASRQLW